MSDQFKVPVEAMRAEISESVYQALSRAGNICAQYCQDDPEMQQAIADGILRFVADGDVLEDTVFYMISQDPELIKRCLDKQTDAVMKQLGEAFTES